jgi:hypothetical protein
MTYDELSEGFDVTSDEYYKEIDKRIRKEFLYNIHPRS